jgi:hypothetical protein
MCHPSSITFGPKVYLPAKFYARVSVDVLLFVEGEHTSSTTRSKDMTESEMPWTSFMSCVPVTTTM